MSSKGGEQGKKITAITVALKTRVPEEGTQDSRFFFSEKGMDKLLV